MRKLLNTLYVMSEDAYLSLEGETEVVDKGGMKAGQFPLHNIENILVFSYKGASPALMGKCAEKNVGISFYTPYGRYLCRVNNNEAGNVLIRREQYRYADNDEMCASIAKNFILGKVFNARWSIDRTVRDHALRINQIVLKEAIIQLDGLLQQIRSSEDIDNLRGLEGLAAAKYFSVFDHLILNQKDVFVFCTINFKVFFNITQIRIKAF